ncbi:hypothetical protein MuYL_3035 [Mucilaginibacter xinganensis]|uniref:Uncharacterized protein n=1 Tax=Mucilaginibacter xinganensis TaxID=1234841 RepID=A0A223NYR2_9SPHI|nr:hypothetical protein MuYL_3035 [Mucilaginibacter xinganensis]
MFCKIISQILDFNIGGTGINNHACRSELHLEIKTGNSLKKYY